jgi:ribosome maturation factor RimP
LDITERVRALIHPVLAEQGIDVVDVIHTGATLQVFVERPDGIDIEAVSAASEIVSSILDREDPVPGRYTLEVSSPGVERPLRTPDHFRRFVGTDVSVRTRPEVEGERRLEGSLVAADEDGIVVEVDGAERRLGYAEIERARTRFVWGPTPRPSGPEPKRKKRAVAR